MISGIGKNPNNNLSINDFSVGYIDMNNTLYFSNENLSFQVSNILDNDMGL